MHEKDGLFFPGENAKFDLNNFDKKRAWKEFFKCTLLLLFYFPVLEKLGTQHTVFEYSVRKPLHS